MAVLDIITAPDPRLKEKSLPIERVDDEIRQLMGDMLETMYIAPGIGLSAPQVGVLKRVIVVDVSKDENNRVPHMMANPEVIWSSDELVDYEEGCLSLPEHYSDVTRPDKIKLRYLDQQNEIREMECEGLLATCIQHEIDHLDGVLFVDHISKIKRDLILRKLTKAKKLAAKEKARSARRQKVAAGA